MNNIDEKIHTSLVFCRPPVESQHDDVADVTSLQTAGSVTAGGSSVAIKKRAEEENEAKLTHSSQSIR